MSYEFPPLAIVRYWADVTDHLIELVDLIPDEKLDWSPSQDSWSARLLLHHLMMGRHHWLANSVKDGQETPDVASAMSTKEGIKDQLRLSWERLAFFLRDSRKLNATYEPAPFDLPRYIDPEKFDGHWIAYTRLVHDLQHRADILQLVLAMGIDPWAEKRRRPF